MSAQPCGCDPEANHYCQNHELKGVIARLRENDQQTLSLPDAQPAAAQPTQFVTKDSGERMEFATGMMRDIEDQKTDYSLMFDGPMYERWAELLTRGAKKYTPRNWMKAATEEEIQRFKRSAARHFFQWMRGDTDEDHAAAVMFNINGYEYVTNRLASDKTS